MPQTSMSVAERVVDRVAEAKNQNALEQETLYEVIDPDALNSIIDSMANGEITFYYSDYFITIDSDGEIELDPKAKSGTNPVL